MARMKELNQCICEALEDKICEELSMEKCQKTYELAEDLLNVMVDTTQRYEKVKEKYAKKGLLEKLWKKEN